jgi:ABC-type protease/lipase transport system fused ATPase/permease subunit
MMFRYHVVYFTNKEHYWNTFMMLAENYGQVKEFVNSLSAENDRMVLNRGEDGIAVDSLQIEECGAWVV